MLEAWLLASTVLASYYMEHSFPFLPALRRQLTLSGQPPRDSVRHPEAREIL